MPRTIWIIASTLVLGSLTDLPACSCAPSLPLCTGDLNSLEQRQGAVFVATVKGPSSIYDRLAQYSRDRLEDLSDSQFFEEDEPGLIEGMKMYFWFELLRWTLSSEESPELAVEVDVLETFVGEIPDQVVVSTGIGFGDCGVLFENGETYLIEASPVREGVWSTNICTLTGHIDHIRVAEDLKALRAWDEGQPLAPQVYGDVYAPSSLTDLQEDGISMASGVSMKLSGDDGVRRTVTNTEGQFWFENLPSGVYQLEVDHPGEIHRVMPWEAWPQNSTIDLTQSRCAEVTIFLH